MSTEACGGFPAILHFWCSTKATPTMGVPCSRGLAYAPLRFTGVTCYGRASLSRSPQGDSIWVCHALIVLKQYYPSPIVGMLALPG